MGTNYYLHLPGFDECPECGCMTRPRRMHIGKSSGGWCFGLRVIPEKGIKGLGDWKAAWSREGAEIRDEYGYPVEPSHMEDIIRDRSWRDGPPSARTLRRNNAVEGPCGLMRRRVGSGLCIGHGEGTWDLLAGDFS